jgi:acyl-CoA reductase-like NAD-dependent aldehyde dehydrogenase
MTAVQDALGEYLMVIGGAATGAVSGRTYDSLDPYTGRPWARVPDAGPEDVDAAVAAARAALGGPWGQLTATQRGKLLHRLGDL